MAEEIEPKFEIEANISRTIKTMLNHVDRYQINFHIDFIYDRLILVGVSPNKSKLVSVISKFTTLFKELQGKRYFNFVCKIPEFSDYSKFKIVKDGEDILLGNDKLVKSVFYEEELYTDWNGTGEAVYEHLLEIDSKKIKDILKTYPDISEVGFEVDKLKNVYLILDNEDDQIRYDLGKTTRSKNGFDSLKYSFCYDDLVEVLDDEGSELNIYLNKDCPVLIKKKSEQDSIKKSYIMYALI